MILHCKNAEMTIILSFLHFYSVKSYNFLLSFLHFYSVKSYNFCYFFIFENIFFLFWQFFTSEEIKKSQKLEFYFFSKMQKFG